MTFQYKDEAESAAHSFLIWFKFGSVLVFFHTLHCDISTHSISDLGNWRLKEDKDCEADKARVEGVNKEKQAHCHGKYVCRVACVQS